MVKESLKLIFTFLEFNASEKGEKRMSKDLGRGVLSCFAPGTRSSIDSDAVAGARNLPPVSVSHCRSFRTKKRFYKLFKVQEEVYIA
jgi:hypothetical protein